MRLYNGGGNAERSAGTYSHDAPVEDADEHFQGRADEADKALHGRKARRHGQVREQRETKGQGRKREALMWTTRGQSAISCGKQRKGAAGTGALPMMVRYPKCHPQASLLAYSQPTVKAVVAL